MVLRLYGHPLSSCTQRVLIVSKEVQVPVEFVEIDLFSGQHKSQEFLQHQPFGQVPYLHDTEANLILYESRAIARYIATLGTPNKLVPDPTSSNYGQSLAKFEQAVSIETTNFTVLAADLAYECIFKSASGRGSTDQNRVDNLVSVLDSKLDGYERILSKQAFLAGDDMTLADLFHGPWGKYLEKMGLASLLDTQARPHVAKWWKGIISRESVVSSVVTP